MTNRLLVLTSLVVLALAALAQAQTFTTLYKFTGGSDGAFPYAGAIQDPTGNLYGTASEGGGCGYYCGVVYELDPAGTETVLHSFIGEPSDGEGPVTPVTRDKPGNTYGTASIGGPSNQGIVFKIDTAGSKTVLHSFTGGSDGCYPTQGLIMDKAGNLYGTTNGCGSSANGTVYKVNSAGNFTLLHTFNGSDGANPYLGDLTMDKSGNLYGVTDYGDTSNYGELYRLSESGTLTLLHSFKGGTSDGCGPLGSVVQDDAGNLFGTTYGCGSRGKGTIWKVSKKGKDHLAQLYRGTQDGCYAKARVARDLKGNLYGVTDSCGASNSGTLYELSARGRLTLLHSFDSLDGAIPVGEVLRTPRGKLFGTTFYGYGGTVWSYVP